MRLPFLCVATDFVLHFPQVMIHCATTTINDRVLMPSAVFYWPVNYFIKRFMEIKRSRPHLSTL